MIQTRYRTVWRRFFAGLIDKLLFLVFPFATFLIMPKENHLIMSVWLVTSMWMFVIYSVLLHGFLGQTVGKMITKVKVLDISEKPLSFIQAIKRDIFIIICNIIYTILFILDISGIDSIWYKVLDSSQEIWFILEILTLLFNEKRRALHDYIAGSVVVRVKYLGKPENPDICPKCKLKIESGSDFCEHCGQYVK